MDPLEALQKYVAKEAAFQEVEHNGEVYYAFGDFAYPKTTLTGIPIYGKSDEYYTLEALLLFYKNLSLGHGVYVKEAASRDVRAITRIDRKNVQEYLEGKSLPNQGLIPSVPPIPLKSIISTEPDFKKIKTEPEALEVVNPTAPSAQVEVRALNENLTVDKIAEMRRKRQMHQKKNIVATDESAPTSSAMSSAMRQTPTVRVHRTRENVMLGNRDLSGVLDIISSAQRQWDINEKKEKIAALHAQNASNHANQQLQNQQQQQQQHRGYSRYSQETFAPDQVKEFQTEMSFIGSNLHALKQGAGLSKPLPTPTRSLSNTVPNAPSAPNAGKRPSRTPIIVVPAALNTVVNMYNAKDILESYSFVPSNVRRAETNKKPMDVVIQRKKNGNTFNIRVIDNTDRLASEDWDRIIAVVVMGAAWQFKGWKWNGNPTDIFTHIPAFHFYLDNDKPATQVQNWNVHKIPISLQKRHMDRARFSQVWETIENFVRKNKPQLAPRLGL